MRPALVAAVHATQMGYATMMQPRRASAWTFAGTAPIVSDGASGSYLEAATNAAARVVLPGGTAPGGFAFSCWVNTEFPGGAVFIAGDAVAGPAVSLSALNEGEPDGYAYGYVIPDGSGSSLGSVGNASISDPGHLLLTYYDGTLSLFVNGTLTHSDDVDSGTLSASDAFTLWRAAEPQAGFRRSPSLWIVGPTTTFGEDEVAALYAAGVDHDLRSESGDYTSAHAAALAHWWPALGDTLPTIVDRGLVGGCNLTASGGISIGSP